MIAQIGDHRGKSLQPLETGLGDRVSRPLSSHSASSIDHLTLLMYHICSGTAQTVILMVFLNLLCVLQSGPQKKEELYSCVCHYNLYPLECIIYSQMCCIILKYFKCFLILFCNILYLLLALFIFLCIPPAQALTEMKDAKSSIISIDCSLHKCSYPRSTFIVVLLVDIGKVVLIK